MRNKNAKVSNPNDFFTCPGSREKILYSAKVQADGSLDIVPSGKEDIQDKIESYRDTTDMRYILKQMALGDTSVLNASPGQYGDFTKMPKTMVEALQLRIDAEKAFYDLSVETRAKFDYDLNKWLASAGSDEWNEKMNFIKPVEENKEEEVTPE